MKHQANGCKKPKIIVLTYAYNVEKYIPNALQSMISQTYDNWEWYLTDNASTDRTPNIIEDFLQAHPDERIHYFKRKYNSILHPGKEKDPFSVCVLPSLVGKGYYITSLDSDDYFEPRALEIMAKPVIEHGVDYVITGRQAFSNADHYDAELPVTRLFPDIADLSDVWPQNYVCMRTVWGKLFHLDGYYAVLQNKERQGISNGNDTYMNLLYMQTASSAASVGEVTVHFCIRPDSVFRSNVFPERYRAYVKIYQKTIELFRQWNRMQSSNLFFAARVLQSSMLETILPTTRNVQSPTALKLLKNILTDPTVHQVLSKYELYDAFLEQVFALLQKNAVWQPEQGSIPCEKYFHIWILRALLHPEQDWYLRLCCLLRGVLMGDNRFRVGMKYLRAMLVENTQDDCQKDYSSLSESDMKNLSATNPLAFTAFLCRDTANQEQDSMDDDRKKVIDSLQKGNNRQVEQAVSRFAQHAPLDYIVLYAKMYLACVKNDTEAACCIAGTVEFLYPYNSLLVDMAGTILEEGGHSHMAYALYKKHRFYAEDTEKIQIQQNLQRLEDKMQNT
ncbi:MAG: glycosyltransferase family 2 protein [Butyricicoccus sp.]|nr:glycosyltransferase family 2 protein [Butyricicoccus sp.]